MLKRLAGEKPAGRFFCQEEAYGQLNLLIIEQQSDLDFNAIQSFPYNKTQ